MNEFNLIAKFRRLAAKQTIRNRESVYEKDGHRLKYLYLASKCSNNLLVVFSAFPGPRGVAGYNMVATFAGVNIHRLYILDDFGDEARGAYYLSENGDFYVATLVDDLLSRFMPKGGKTYFVGSSKGGYAALYFGIRRGADYVVSGAPQYYIGSYLMASDHAPVLAAMAGDTEKETIARYDKLLPDLIATSHEKKPIVVLHYSEKEPTFGAHIQYLLSDLRTHGYTVRTDTEEYMVHSDVANYFPQLCCRILKELK